MIPLNTQPPMKQDLTLAGPVTVNVWRTIQGEGPFAGRPAVFVRLAGCNLQCPQCDTDYMIGSGVVTWNVDHLATEVWNHTKALQTNLVVLTGGEPFRQDIGPLVRALCLCGLKVQIETNGTLYLPDFPYFADVTIVCSPKTGKVNDQLRPYIHYLKYVVTHGQIDPEDGLPTSVLGNNVRVQRPWYPFQPWQVYVQPADEQDPERNRLNTQAALDSCMKFGYTFALQIHKITGME